MAEKICKAILDLRPDDYDEVHKQGTAFIEKMYQETILYPTPRVPEADFKIMVDDAGKAITAAVKGGDIEKATRADTCLMLYNAMGKKLIPYINSIWAGNRTNLEKSGAKISADPSPVPAPDQPVISRIARGPEDGSIKVYLVRGVNSSLKKRSRTLYRIFMFEKEDDVKGTEVGSSYNSTNLIGNDIPVAVNRYFGVRAQNSGGSSPLSSKVKYYLLA